MIKTRYQIEPTSPGAMLREELRKGTDLGREADSFTSRGQLAPDSLVVALVENWLKFHGGRFVFDGFPRTIAQAEALAELLQKQGTPLDVVFFFNVPFETIKQRVLHRLTCGECGRIFSVGLHFGGAVGEVCPVCHGPLDRRVDDTLEALEQRMVEYREKTEPLIAYYRKRGMLKELSAAEHPDSVFAEIVSFLEAA